MAAETTHARGLLVGGRFSELEDALVERVAELRAERPLAPLTIVVGSAALTTRVGDLLACRLGAVAGIAVVTFARLATDTAAHAAGAAGRPPRRADALVRARLVRQAISARRAVPGLRYFAPVSMQPHFAQALAATFDDLRQARVPSRPGWAKSAVPGKASDLEALYAAYCAALDERGLYDDAALHLAATAATEETRTPPPAQTLIYGVYDLNAAQEALVAALLAAGADLFLPVPRAGGTESAPALRLARAAGVSERLLPAPPPLDDLARVAAALAEPRAPGVATLQLTGDGSFTVISVPDERSEVREAVREVIAAAVAPGAAARLWDCAVVVPQASDIARMATGLHDAGVPVACRRPDHSPGARALSRLLDCLAPAAGAPFGRRAVLDLLAAAAALPPRPAGLGEQGAQVPAAEAARWADEARRAGVVAGLDQWSERVAGSRYGLERRMAELGAEETPPAEADDEREGGERRERLEARLAAARSLERAIGSLARACALLPERASWAGWADALVRVVDRGLPDADGAGARDAAARLHALDEVDELVDVGEMAAVLREQLAAATAGHGRVGREGVAVLTPLELRGLRFHTVVFSSVAEGGFPARGRPDPIYGDAERQRTAAALGVRLPLAEDREAESALLFALALEAARERLTLLAPRTEAATGRPRLPSRLLLRIAALATGRAVGLEDFLSGAPLRPVWRRVSGRGPGAAVGGAPWADLRERDIATLLATGVEDAAAAAEYLAAVLAAPDGEREAHRRLAQWRSGRAATAGVYDGVLGPAAREAIAARDLFAAELHPTSLERYLDCPFAYFLRDVLGLSAPEEPDDDLEMDPRAFGTLAHEILRRVYEEVISGGLDRGRALALVDGAWQAACDEARRRGVTGAELAWSARRQALREDLLMCVGRDPVFAAGGERPALVEWGFGAREERVVGLELPGGRRVRFAGRVDRVDATSQGARVVDYKTGSGTTEENRLKARLSVQLPVYRLAVRQHGAVGPGEIECLYRAVTRRGGFAEHKLQEDEAATNERLRGLVADVVTLVEAGVFARASLGGCNWCELSYACGVSRWARARKRRHEALAAVVGLQAGTLSGEGADGEATDGG